MAWVDTAYGRIDVSPNIVDNASIGATIGAVLPNVLGNVQNGGQSNASDRIGVDGAWYQVGDTALWCEQATIGAGTLDNWYLVDPDGNQLYISHADADGSYPWFHWDDKFFLRNARVRLTVATRPYLEKLGIISKSTPAINTQPTAGVGERFIDTVQANATTVVTAGAVGLGSLAIIALVVGAIIYYPEIKAVLK